MPELKLECDCGQKFKFEVEPENGVMPFSVSCPACGLDGTDKANGLLQAREPAVAAAPPIASGQLRLSATPPPVPTAPPRYPSRAGEPRVPMPAVRPPQRAAEPSNLALGIVGALIGAAVGAGLMYGFFAATHVRFPLLGTGVGALTGLGARILYRGTDDALGAVSAGIAAVAVIGVLCLMYGAFFFMGILSIILSASFAYRIAS